MKSDSQLDDTDLRIVDLLLKDARKSSRQIARELKITHQTVISRLKRLEEKGVITEYTAVVDWSRLGYSVKSLFLVEVGKLDEEKLGEIQEYIKREPCFTSAGTLSGDYDLYVIGKFKSQEEALQKTTSLRAFLGKRADLRIFRTYQVWKTVKDTRPAYSP